MDTIESQHSEISSVSEQLTTLKCMVLAGFGGFWRVLAGFSEPVRHNGFGGFCAVGLSLLNKE